jgi:hypothetical protein
MMMTNLNRYALCRPRLPMLLVLTALSTAHHGGHAAEPSPPAAQVLAPDQLDAIRSISRSVLAAKKSGTDNPADGVQLAGLRAVLDQLLAAEFDPNNQSPITAKSSQGPTAIGAKAPVNASRAQAQSQALVVLEQLRQRAAGAPISQSTSVFAVRSDSTEVTSGGLPVGEQRSRAFERWATKLEAAIAPDNPNRGVQLWQLREQLKPSKQLPDAPVARRTPSLQAMPAGFVSPKEEQ